MDEFEESSDFSDPKLIGKRSRLKDKKWKYLWISEKLTENFEEFVEYFYLKILCITWNVNNKLVGSDTINDLIDDEQYFSEGSVVPDIITVGLQEVDRSAEAFIYQNNNKEVVWRGILIQGLERKFGENSFVWISSSALVGILTFVFVKREHYKYVEKVSTSTCTCGLLGGMLGNKGGTAIRFRIYNEYVCVINSHLAAHSDQVIKRNQDFKEISNRIIFSSCAETKIPHDSNEKGYYFCDKYNFYDQTFWSIDDCSILIWLGDLNYRVDLSNDVARAFLRSGKIQTLLEYDQLKLERNKRNVFVDYKESKIDFLPSYSFNSGTDEYDTSAKQRVPSWCDRILWKSENKVIPKFYKMIEKIRISDHKPVKLYLKVNSKRINTIKFNLIYDKVMKQLDKLENSFIPKTHAIKNVVNVGVVPFMKPILVSFELRNDGDVTAHYVFIPKPNNTEVTPSWLKLNKESGSILPKKTVNLTGYIVYDKFSANSIRSSCSQDNNLVEDCLIVHIHGGRDHFLLINFEPRKTGFSRDLSELIFCNTYLRCEGDIGNKLYQVPHTIWRIINFISEKGIETNNLFLISGREDYLEQIQTAIDLDEDFLDVNLNEDYFHSLAEILFRFLDSLPESLIPNCLWTQCQEFPKKNNYLYQILKQIPENNLQIILYLMAFLKYVYLPKNDHADLNRIANIFSHIIMKKEDDSKKTAKEIENSTNFLINLLSVF